MEDREPVTLGRSGDGLWRSPDTRRTPSDLTMDQWRLGLCRLLDEFL